MQHRVKDRNTTDGLSLLNTYTVLKMWNHTLKSSSAFSAIAQTTENTEIIYLYSQRGFLRICGHPLPNLSLCPVAASFNIYICTNSRDFYLPLTNLNSSIADSVKSLNFFKD